jgi:hypothetical protein
MLLGRSVLNWIFVGLVAVCVFLIAQWLIPVIFGKIGISIPDQIVNVLSLLLALGVVFWGYRWPWHTPPA